MFEWYWFFLYYIIVFHISSVATSLYVHRTIGHGLFKISKSLEYVFRFILWTNESIGPLWAETYASRHRKHHGTSDTIGDPHSPYQMTFSEICRPWIVNWEDVKKYCPEIKTPDDWMQRIMHEKYRKLGPWFLHLVALILFGPIGMILSVVIRELTKKWLVIWVGVVATHTVGFSYAGNRSKGDRSKNIFPIGILLSGEELHANHHNYPKSPNFRRRWFEIDIGYVYAIILSKCGLLTIKNNK